jgi:hypothetical protein
VTDLSFEKDGLDKKLEADTKALIEQSKSLEGEARQFKLHNPVYPFFFEVSDPSALPAHLRTLYNSLEKGEPVDFEGVTRAFVEDECKEFELEHGKADAVPVDEIQRYLSELSGRVPPLQMMPRLANLKRFSEEQMASFPGRPLKYNKDARTIVDVVERDRVQCLSGSAFLQTLAREHWGPEGVRASNLVFGYGPGHRFAGQFGKNVQDEWEFQGVETTVAGQGRMKPKPAKDLKGPVRIVDSELTFLASIFAPYLKDPKKTRDQILDWTAKKYGIDLSQFSYDKPISDPIPGRTSDIFSFGHVDIPEGDLERPKIRDLDLETVLSDAPREPKEMKGTASGDPIEDLMEDLLESDAGAQQEMKAKFDANNKEGEGDKDVKPVRNLFSEKYIKQSLIDRYLTKIFNKRYEFDKNHQNYVTLTPAAINTFENLLTDPRTREAAAEWGRYSTYVDEGSPRELEAKYQKLQKRADEIRDEAYKKEGGSK